MYSSPFCNNSTEVTSPETSASANSATSAYEILPVRVPQNRVRHSSDFSMIPYLIGFVNSHLSIKSEKYVKVSSNRLSILRWGVVTIRYLPSAHRPSQKRICRGISSLLFITGYYSPNVMVCVFVRCSAGASSCIPTFFLKS